MKFKDIEDLATKFVSIHTDIHKDEFYETPYERSRDVLNAFLAFTKRQLEIANAVKLLQDEGILPVEADEKEHSHES